MAPYMGNRPESPAPHPIPVLKLWSLNSCKFSEPTAKWASLRIQTKLAGHLRILLEVQESQWHQHNPDFLSQELRSQARGYPPPLKPTLNSPNIRGPSMMGVNRSQLSNWEKKSGERKKGRRERERGMEGRRKEAGNLWKNIMEPLNRCIWFYKGLVTDSQKSKGFFCDRTSAKSKGAVRGRKTPPPRPRPSTGPFQ